MAPLRHRLRPRLRSCLRQRLRPCPERHHCLRPRLRHHGLRPRLGQHCLGPPPILAILASHVMLPILGATNFRAKYSAHRTLRANERRTSSQRSGAYKLEPKRGCDSFFSYISCRIINYFHKFPLITFFFRSGFQCSPHQSYIYVYIRYYILHITYLVNCLL